MIKEFTDQAKVSDLAAGCNTVSQYVPSTHMDKGAGTRKCSKLMYGAINNATSSFTVFADVSSCMASLSLGLLNAMATAEITKKAFQKDGYRPRLNKDE